MRSHRFSVGLVLPYDTSEDSERSLKQALEEVCDILEYSSKRHCTVSMMLPCLDTPLNRVAVVLARRNKWTPVAVGNIGQRGGLNVDRVIGIQATTHFALTELVGRSNQILVCIGDTPEAQAARRAFLSDAPNAIRSEVDKTFILRKTE